MKKLADSLYSFVVTLWIGGIWTIGYVVAPTLFSSLNDKQLAGSIAGNLFSVSGWVGIGCASFLAVFLLSRHGVFALRLAVFWLLLLMLALTLLSQFGLQPFIAHLKEGALPSKVMESVVRDRFATWHGIASMLYLLQSVLGLALLLKAERARS
jgi:hypothetical protein